MLIILRVHGDIESLPTDNKNYDNGIGDMEIPGQEAKPHIILSYPLVLKDVVQSTKGPDIQFRVISGLIIWESHGHNMLMDFIDFPVKPPLSFCCDCQQNVNCLHL